MTREDREADCALRYAVRGEVAGATPRGDAWLLAGGLAAAMQLRAIDTDLTVDVEGMLAAQRGPIARALLSVSRVLPRVAGRDLRSAYYWSRAARAYARGVRAGSASSS